jgi:23S rRNA (cytosine1962-C5)-methyltransferase
MTTTPGGYSLLDFGEGRRLEQWGAFRLVRPDPTARGGVAKAGLWRAADAVYEGEKGRGRWVERGRLPEHWAVAFDDLTLAVRLAPYKHTGVFPEQLENWRWVRERGRAAGRELSVLNLFAYTGVASVALAKDGHFVTHVDAAKPSIGWAKTNAEMNGLPGDRVRWILEDAPKFVAREIRRGKRYDGIILDPPAFGHSPTGKTWRVERDLGPLLEDCRELLSERPAFLVLNGYAQNDTPSSFHRLLSGVLRGRAGIEARELTLKAADGRELSTGIVARCSFG